MARYTPPVIFTQLPGFTISGLLPPYVGADPTNQALISPYPTTVDVLATQFAISPKRIAIFKGFLAFRETLAAIGIADGFQWIDGSFSEHVEMREGRDPGDIDVVTFFKRPSAATDELSFGEFVTSNQNVFTPAHAKKDFGCDAYFVDLNLEPMSVVAQTRYWYGLFSHRRSTGEWKGMIEVPLAISQADSNAAAVLIQRGSI